MVRIPITGIGVVAPGAIGVDAFRALLAGGRSSVVEIDRFDTAGLSAHKAALLRDFKPRDYIAPMKMRRMNALSRLGVAAAKLAIDDCGAAPGPETGVAIGTSFGPVQTSVEYMQEYVEKGPSLAPPQLFAESVANAPGSHIAIEWGLRGFNVTITQRESSALAAAMYAATQIVKGSVPSALIGGVEEANEMLFSVLDRIGALAHANGTADEAARPFDRRRNGIALGEGGAVLIAGAGTRKPYGWLSGFGIARDTTASISDWGSDPQRVVVAMQAALDDAELPLESIDAIYASANGSLRGDAVEQQAIQSLFGANVPPVVATKGLFGEYAAGGALQLAAALIALDEQKLHASPGFEQGDLPVTRETRDAELRHLLVHSVSAGGGIVCAVLSREGA
ncbi:MAG TPA: beta-ketoacyl synthase N-terminal-like domain-containing protein [Thermoanaerobaculia bacterium]|nr:beta-ketoacyl synthase N-terminal-like domain-containing protein [Thermoanaerobaculia bacterium]